MFISRAAYLSNLTILIHLVPIKTSSILSICNFKSLCRLYGIADICLIRRFLIYINPTFIIVIYRIVLKTTFQKKNKNEKL